MTRLGGIGIAMSFVVACATARPPAPAQRSSESPVASDAEARRKDFDKLLAEHWEYNLSHHPVAASLQGDKRWNDKWPDVSAEGVAANLASTKQFLTRFEVVDVAGFPEQEALTHTLLVRDLREELDNARFEAWKMPVAQVGGIHLQAARIPALLSFGSAKDYED